jgi:hypothetical protein
VAPGPHKNRIPNMIDVSERPAVDVFISHR